MLNTDTSGVLSGLPMIVVGSYEEFLLGYQIKKNEGKESFKLVFSTHAHIASVRCVDSHSHFLTSSGADEYINVYDVLKMQESTVLAQHSGTVTGLQFTPDGSHLISASQDGSIAIFQCQNWKLVKWWKNAHGGANGATAIAVHPAGMMLLSIGADNILKMWNLVKGRLAYAKNYAKHCGKGDSLEMVCWSPSGSSFAVSLGKKVIVYFVSTAGVLYEFESNARVTAFQFALNDLMFVGTEEGTIEVRSVSQKALRCATKCHDKRIKCMKVFYVGSSKPERKKKTVKFYVVSGDSGGAIKLWHLKQAHSVLSLELRCEVNADCRLTCMTTVTGAAIKEEVQVQVAAPSPDPSRTDSSDLAKKQPRVKRVRDLGEKLEQKTERRKLQNETNGSVKSEKKRKKSETSLSKETKGKFVVEESVVEQVTPVSKSKGWNVSDAGSSSEDKKKKLKRK